MSSFLSPEQLRHRTERAVAAATRAARELDLTVTEPRVLHDVFSVIVHLEPSDVVARVPVVLPPGKTDPRSVAARQRRELDVVAWLAEQGLPVVPPSPRVPREPVVTEEFSLTLWQYVDVAPTTELDVVGNAGLVPRLHRVLRDYPEPLPALSVYDWIPDALAHLEAEPGIVEAADLDRARREWEVLAPVVATAEALSDFCGGLSMQPLHGDSPAVNLLHTVDGVRYADFEDPLLGPIEFDLALLGHEAIAAYDEAAERQGLRRVNPRALRVIEAVAFVQAVACFAMVPRLPVLAEYLEYSLPDWRRGPFAGGVTD